MRLRWAESAQSDLAQIQAFIARDSIAYSEAVIDRIITRAEGLVDFPQSGQAVPEYRRAEIREVFVHAAMVVVHVALDNLDTNDGVRNSVFRRVRANRPDDHLRRIA